MNINKRGAFYLKHYQEKLKKVDQTCNALPCGSWIKICLEKILKDAEKKIAASSGKEWFYWPSLFLFVAQRSLGELLDFENDLRLVRHHGNQHGCNDPPPFLEALDTGTSDREWGANLFEIFVKSRFIQEMSPHITLDPSLPNGKRPDILIKLKKREIYLECTVLTDSDETREQFKAWSSSTTLSDSKSGIYEGSVREVNVSTEIEGRFYDKVFDKLAPNLDPGKSQLSENHPNVLLISLDIPRGGLIPEDFTEYINALFSDRPPKSLEAWLEYKQKQPNSKKFEKKKLLGSIKKVSAIFLFNRCKLFSPPVINLNATNRLKNEEAQFIKNLLQIPPTWEIPFSSNQPNLQTTATAKGQIVIPAKIRERLEIKEGTKILVRVNDQDEIILSPVTRRRIESLAGKYFGESLLEALLEERRRELEME